VVCFLQEFLTPILLERTYIMSDEPLIQLLTDPEQQPHQYVGKADALRSRLFEKPDEAGRSVADWRGKCFRLTEERDTEHELRMNEHKRYNEAVDVLVGLRSDLQAAIDSPKVVGQGALKAMCEKIDKIIGEG
jgi:hypothetical protein